MSVTDRQLALRVAHERSGDWFSVDDVLEEAERVYQWLQGVSDPTHVAPRVIAAEPSATINPDARVSLREPWVLYYTEGEMGAIQEQVVTWISQEEFKNQLRSIWPGMDQPCVLPIGKVHAVFFPDGSRWSCVTGWHDAP